MPRGGATAYGSRVVCPSVCPPRISRHSLKTKRWNLQHKQKLTLEQVCIERISILSLRSRDLLTSESMAVAGDLDSSEDKTVYSWLPSSKFVCTTEKRGRSGEKAREGRHRSSLYYTRAIVQSRPAWLCGAYSVNSSLLVADYSVNKQQLISCKLLYCS